MSWESSIKGFKSYLQIERSLSENTVLAYIRDITRFSKYAKFLNLDELNINRVNISDFLITLNSKEISPSTQARIISGIRAFYKFLIMEGYISYNPTDLIESPRLGIKLPDTLLVFLNKY